MRKERSEVGWLLEKSYYGDKGVGRLRHIYEGKFLMRVLARLRFYLQLKKKSESDYTHHKAAFTCTLSWYYYY